MILIALNLAVCLGGAYLCICRMTHMSKADTPLPVRQFYTLFFMLFIASGISFLWEIDATILQLAQSGAILVYLIWDKRRGEKPKTPSAHFGFYGAQSIESRSSGHQPDKRI